MRARVGNLGADWAELGDAGEDLLQPIIDEAGSDSARLDQVLELLVRGGRSAAHAVAMMVPQVWEGARDLHPRVTDFYRYHSSLIEPWDGPAGLVFTDGLRLAAALDRNGLRPLRYSICDDGFVVVSSEVGAVRIKGHGSVRRDRLGPGQMLVVDPALGGVLENDQVKADLARRKPYGEWLRAHMTPVGPGLPVDAAPEDLGARQVVAGYTKEEEIDPRPKFVGPDPSRGHLLGGHRRELVKLSIAKGGQHPVVPLWVYALTSSLDPVQVELAAFVFRQVAGVGLQRRRGVGETTAAQEHDATGVLRKVLSDTAADTERP